MEITFRSDATSKFHGSVVRQFPDVQKALILKPLLTGCPWQSSNDRSEIGL